MIILIGFPKSATSSFNELFKNIGYNSYHQFYNEIPIAKIIKMNMLNDLPMLNGFPKDIALTQIDYCWPHFTFFPQIEYYQKLYEENKDSVFILNKRSPHEILKSIKKWKDYYIRLFIYGSYLFTEIEGTTKDKKFINLLNKHYDNIESFFNKLPDAKFISYDINKDSIVKLSPYINIKKEIMLPHVNKATPVVDKCLRDTCIYLKHPEIDNNDGTHCCVACRDFGIHGPNCMREMYNLRPIN